MASAVAVNHLQSVTKTTCRSAIPGDTNSHYAAWVDMQAFTHLLALITYIVRVGHLTQFALYTSAASDGSGAVKIRDYAGTVTAADAVDDTLVLECSAEELQALGSGLRYVSVAYTASDAGDKLAVAYVQSAKDAKDGLTADVLSD